MSNTDKYNTGDWNTGNRNTGNRNTGCWNTGDGNTGDGNTGDWNTGDRNAGNRNTGYWNAGDRNTGYCNTDTPKVRMFNHDTDMKFNDSILLRFRAIMSDCPCTHSDYINVNDMSDEEKKNHPEYKSIGGYLKVFEVSRKEKQEWWDERVSDEDKEFIWSLPYFDAAIFEECTGIRVAENCKQNTVCHNLKILSAFADAVLMGYKPFEVRENDRAFQKGDTVRFIAVDKRGNELHHKISTKIYEITYVLSGWGIRNGYVVFGIREV